MVILLTPLLASLLSVYMASAQLAVSANDNKVSLVNGVSTVAQNPLSDTDAIIDLKQFPPRLLKGVTGLGTIKLDHEKTGVSHVAIAPDGNTAIVTRYGDSLI